MHILIVDDHALFREGLRFLLRKLDDELIIDEAESCEQGVKFAAEQTYDLILLDLKLPDHPGFTALERLRETRPDIPVVVLSGEDAPRTVRAAIDAGAMGFIPKSSSSELLVNALRLVLGKGVYLPPRILGPDTDHGSGSPVDPDTLSLLTSRQMEILRGVIQGKPNKVIARDLDIAESTIKAHLSAVLRLLGASNRTEAVFVAARLGLKIC